MSLVTRYIMKQIWVPAVIALVVISFVLVAGAIQNEVKALLKDVPIAQITMIDISWISFYSLPTLVGFLFPVTFLMAIMLTFSRMAQNNEFTALKSAGIPLKRLILPVVLMGVLLSGICFLALDYGKPWAYKQLTKLVRSDLPLRVTIDMLPTGIMQEYGEWRIYVGEKERDGRLRNIVVLQPLPDGRANAFYAESARLVKTDGVSSLEMEHGHYIQAEKKDLVPRTTFELGKRTVPPLKSREVQGERKGMTMEELFAAERETEKKYFETKAIPVERDLRALRVELAQRFGFPLMCLAVCVVGAPIGARSPRAGRSFNFAIGLAILTAYFVLTKATEPRGLQPFWQVVMIVQTPNLLLCGLGAYLIWRVDRV